MSQQVSILSDLPKAITRTDTIEGLGAIDRPEYAAVIWQRQSDTGFQAWINGLDHNELPCARLILRTSEVRSALTDVCTAHNTPDGPKRVHFINDVVALAGIFAHVMKARHLRLRLTAVDTNACRRFHTDAVTARLICTYRGAGTQYGISPDGADPRRIFSVPTSAPIVLRGTYRPEHPASGLLHRSPPIEGTGEVRLVLVLDPVFDPQVAI